MAMLIRKWRDSCLSQSKFAAQHNLLFVKFSYWIKKFKELAGEEPEFIQINGFTTQGINLRYPNGVELLMPVQTPVDVLKDLIHFETRCSFYWHDSS